MECALDGGAEFAKVCTLERQGQQLVVHRPDGGFRRFTEADGGVQPIDGADAVTVSAMPDGGREIAVGEDRYRLPANAPRP